MSRSPATQFADTLVVLAVSAILIGGFSPLFLGWGWYVDVLAALAPVAVVAAAVRLRAPSWASPAAAVTALVALVWAFAPGTTWFGVPTTASAVELRRLLANARTVIVEEVAPITPPDSVLLVVAIVAVVAFVLADAVADQTWRVPLLGLLWATLVVVPSVIAAQLAPWWVFAGAAVGWLWLWWTDASRLRGAATATAALTAAGGLVAALALPVVGPRIEPTSSDLGVADSQVFGAGINPMIELGRSLRQSSPRRVLTYTTDASSGRYLKVATLRQFSGRTWSPSPVTGDLDIEGVDDLDDGIETSEVSTSVRIDSLRSTYLPVPYPATRIRGLEGRWQWLRDGSTVRAASGTTTEGQTYTVASVERSPRAAQLRRAGRPGQDLDSYRSLPRRVPVIVRSQAFEHAGGERSDYDRMLALQNWMRSEFSYSVEAPVEAGYDGNGLDVMGEFLERQEGYCVHFASALAVMGRVLGVPTRVAVGYAPGDSVLRRTTDGTTYGIDSDDLHAWTEAYFEGIGWIAFDATPGIGSATEFVEASSPAGSGSSADVEAPEQRAGQAESDLVATDEAVVVGTETTSTTSRSPGIVAIAVIAVLGVLPATIRALRRRRRWRAGASSTGPLWAEVADTARDLGVDLDPAETPRRFADRLGDLGADRTSLDRLVAQVERDRYGAGTTVVSRVPEAQRVVESLEESRRRRTRWRARLAPRSLVR